VHESGEPFNKVRDYMVEAFSRLGERRGEYDERDAKDRWFETELREVELPKVPPPVSA
jgi:hypothetical protein